MIEISINYAERSGIKRTFTVGNDLTIINLCSLFLVNYIEVILRKIQLDNIDVYG